MSSRVTLALAVLFLLGAIVAGYLGVVVSRQPPPVLPSAPIGEHSQAPVSETVPSPTASEDALRKNVVVLVRDLPAYTAIKTEDLVIERLKVAPEGSFSTVDDVVGKFSWRALAAGSWLDSASFEAGGSLARMIRPDERAMALAVDEVAGAAGNLNPGDYVDVLLYLPQDNNNPQSSTQVVVPALRILSVGGWLGPALDGTPTQAASVDARAQQEQHRASTRSVVVAVPESLQSRLMLATQAGVLRLAVRSAEEKNLQKYWDKEAASRDVALRLDTTGRNLLRFAQLSLSTPAPVAVQKEGEAKPHTAKAVEVIRGNQVVQQNP